MKAYIAVGHGDKPSGAYDAGASSGAWDEQSAGDIIVAEVVRVLREAGLEVYDESFRDDPNFVGTIKMADTWGADILVAVHHDWYLAPEGGFAHWYHPEALPLADSIQDAVKAAGFPVRSDWHKRRTDLSVIKRPKTRLSVLYEAGRIGQQGLDSGSGLERMGRAIAEGIMKFLGVEVEEMTKEEREMLVYSAMWALEAKLDSNIAKHYARGDETDAQILENKRPDDIAYWRERWNVQ